MEFKADFKAGDEVIYFKQKEPVVLEAFDGVYCVGFWLDGCKYSFTKDGREFERDTVPSIFPANAETCKLLNKLTGLDYQSSEMLRGYHAIIKALETRHSVKCLVGDFGYPTNERVAEVIQVAGGGNSCPCYYDSMGYGWDWAELIDI